MNLRFGGCRGQDKPSPRGPRPGLAAMDDLLAVRLDKPLADALDARAAQTRQTRSEVARDLLRQGLAAV